MATLRAYVLTCVYCADANDLLVGLQLDSTRPLTKSRRAFLTCSLVQSSNSTITHPYTVNSTWMPKRVFIEDKLNSTHTLLSRCHNSSAFVHYLIDGRQKKIQQNTTKKKHQQNVCCWDTRSIVLNNEKKRGKHRTNEQRERERERERVKRG